MGFVIYKVLLDISFSSDLFLFISFLFFSFSWEIPFWMIMLNSKLLISFLFFIYCFAGIVNNVKRGRCDFDFVEIMACPGGCNAGNPSELIFFNGQTKPGYLPTYLPDYL